MPYRSEPLQFRITHLILFTLVFSVWAASVRWLGIDLMVGFFLAPLITLNVVVAGLLLHAEWQRTRNRPDTGEAAPDQRNAAKSSGDRHPARGQGQPTADPGHPAHEA